VKVPIVGGYKLKYIQTGLASIMILFAWVAHAASSGETAAVIDQSAEQDFLTKVVAPYQAANSKPGLPDEVCALHAKAGLMVKQGQFQQAADLYAKGLDVAPWWALGHYDRAVLLAMLKQYPQAVLEMNRCLALTPDAPNAEMAQNMISRWKALASNDQPMLSASKDLQPLSASKDQQTLSASKGHLMLSASNSPQLPAGN
jgi:tetratricopeptide (TPR) repeat protein